MPKGRKHFLGNWLFLGAVSVGLLYVTFFAPSGSVTVPRNDWYLWMDDGNVAELVRYPNYPDRIRVELHRVKNEGDWRVRLMRDIATSEGGTYRVQFRARADRPRTISCQVVSGQAPWETFGSLASAQLRDDWQLFELDVTTPREQHDLQLVFNLGEERTDVEIERVQFRPVDTSQSSALESDFKS